VTGLEVAGQAAAHVLTSVEAGASLEWDDVRLVAALLAGAIECGEGEERRMVARARAAAGCCPLLTNADWSRG